MRPQQLFRSFVPQLSPSPLVEPAFCCAEISDVAESVREGLPTGLHVSSNILNQPVLPSAVAAFGTLLRYTMTGP